MVIGVILITQKIFMSVKKIKIIAFIKIITQNVN